MLKPRVGLAPARMKQAKEKATVAATTSAPGGVPDNNDATGHGEAEHQENGHQENGHEHEGDETGFHRSEEHYDHHSRVSGEEVHDEPGQMEFHEEEHAHVIEEDSHATVEEPSTVHESPGLTTSSHSGPESEVHSPLATELEAGIQQHRPEERLDEVKSRVNAGNDIEALVNLLESAPVAKARPLSIASIPDEEIDA